ncbi:MAG: Rieske 2Fe-2S domain-containing protein [Proteobacteria bacterium]|nr:Rieske 2Fe-2S domain-containing protein [Pseudomonadota bacterium]
MSRALDYLMKARPQAMGAYFKFLKDNGSRLDPKTRALISVITKVAVETELGLVQYTRRALEVGASPDEILDALMMAFPALGLSRIVWAVDVLIEHGVEGFAELSLHDDEAAPVAAPRGETLDVCALDQLPERQTVKRNSGRYPLLLWREGGAVRAFKAYCSHQGMELMTSGIKGAQVTCAQHGWQFTLPDGRCSRGDKWGLSELPVTLRGGRVIVQWQD